jgi:hypothetical protein
MMLIWNGGRHPRKTNKKQLAETTEQCNISRSYEVI